MKTTSLAMFFECLLMVGLQGCGSLSSGSSIRSLGYSGDSGREDRIVLTDASNRAITAVNVNLTDDQRRIKPSRIICAEPSPDIATAVSKAVSASLALNAEKGGIGKATGSSTYNQSEAESIAQLGSRLATIQLLRDELSDLCRAYANGAVSSITYTLRLSRLDKKMITLLVAEGGSGALSRALSTINGNAAAGGILVSDERLKMAEKKIVDASKALGAAEKEVTESKAKYEKASDDASRESANKEMIKNEEKAKTRLEELNDATLYKLILESKGAGLANASALSTLPSPSPLSGLGQIDLKGIHRAYLDDDDLGTLLDACLTSMEDNLTPFKNDNVGKDTNPLDVQISEAQKAFDAALKTAEDARKTYESTFPPRSSNQQQQQQRSLSKEEISLSSAERNLESANSRLLQLKAEARGLKDRTSLLSYCKQNIAGIVNILDKKVSHRFANETNNKILELCKPVFADKNGSLKTRGECIRALNLGGSRIE